MTDKKNPFDPAHMTDAMKAQAQQIWLAGLGAFSKAQQDGAKAFEKLIHDGISMQRQAQGTAEEKLAEATKRATQAAQHLNERASGQWDRLEGLFEERVAKALHRMGMPSIHDLQALQSRIDALEAKLHAAPKSASKPTSKPAAKKTTKKPAVKTTSAKKVAKKT
jgi:poly(hydroxyalkanoate) granule-associated protein